MIYTDLLSIMGMMFTVFGVGFTMGLALPRR
jgi:hypothetical protein